MYQKINFSMFCYEWNRWEDRKNRLSYEGKRALFDYLEDLCDDSKDRDGKPIGIELNIVGLCCEWTEYDSIKGVMDIYGAEKWEASEYFESLKERTTVLNCENGHILVANF